MKDIDKYYAVRSRMGTFDRLEFHSNSYIGWRIRRKTKDWSNHSGMIIVFHEYDDLNVYILESLTFGPTLNRLSIRLQNFDGKVRWYPLKPEFHKYRKELGKTMLTLRGTKYDYPSLFKNLSGRVKLDEEKLFCSESLQFVGKQILPCNPNYLDGNACTPGKDLDGLGWWGDGVDIL